MTALVRILNVQLTTVIPDSEHNRRVVAGGELSGEASEKACAISDSSMKRIVHPAGDPDVGPARNR
jgi:hypothetical protein